MNVEIVFVMVGKYMNNIDRVRLYFDLVWHDKNLSKIEYVASYYAIV